jgi:hypothetical protein
MSRKVLMICYLFPPAKSVGVLRLHRFYQSWKAQGDEVRVISSHLRRKLHREALPVEESDIWECPSLDYRSLLHALRPGASQHQSFGGPWAGVKKGLRKILVSLPFSLLLGEGGPLYCLSAYRKACRWARQNPGQVLFSSFSPLIDIFIASRVIKKFPNLHWMADFRDLPMDEALQEILWPQWQIYWIKKWVSRADRVLTVSQGQALSFGQWHPRVQVIMNACSALAPKPAPKPSPFFTVSYTGSLYPGLQDLPSLVKVLETWVQSQHIPLETLQICYAGKDGGLFAEAFAHAALKERLQLKGLISLQAARALQQSSQVNVLLSWSQGNSQGVLSSKLFEYLQAQKPLLALVNGNLDQDFIQLQQDFPQHCIASSQEESKMISYLQKVYSLWQGGAELVCPLAPGYTWEEQWQKISQL